MAARSIGPDGNEPALSVRRVVLLIWATILVLTPYERLAALPPLTFDDVGIVAVFVGRPRAPSALVQYDVLLFLRVSGLLALGISAFAQVPRLRCLSHCFAFASVLVLDSVAKSVGGYVNHAQAVPLIVLGIVTAGQVFEEVDSYWRSRGMSRRDADRRGWSADEGVVWASGVTIVIAYTFTGANRIVYGGGSVVGGDAILPQMVLASYQYSAFGFQVAPDIIETAWGRGLLRTGFAAVTCLEVLAAGVFCRDWFRRVWLLSMSAFHIAALVLMNILFWENILLIWAVFGRSELDAAARMIGRVCPSVHEGARHGHDSGGLQLVVAAEGASIVQGEEGMASYWAVVRTRTWHKLAP